MIEEVETEAGNKDNRNETAGAESVGETDRRVMRG